MSNSDGQFFILCSLSEMSACHILMVIFIVFFLLQSGPRISGTSVVILCITTNKSPLLISVIFCRKLVDLWALKDIGCVICSPEGAIYPEKIFAVGLFSRINSHKFLFFD